MNAQSSVLSNTSSPLAVSPNRILRLPDVLQRTGLSRSGLYERVKDGEFPPSVSLGGRSVGWVEAEIDNWIARLVSHRGWSNRETETREN